jgi:ribonuclease R
MPHRQRAAHTEVAKKHITGIIQITRKGVGYLPFEASAKKGEDIEIQTENLSGALNGDTVEVELKGLFPRPKGRVVKVVERAKTEFVVTLKQQNGKWVGTPADIKFYRPIQIKVGGRQYVEGSKALIKLISFTGKEDPVGEVTEVIGRSGEHRTEMNAIVLAHGFSTTFPEAVLKEAEELEQNHASIIAAEVSKRADYRGVPTMTIDPIDAKDFDDALSLQTLPNGDFEIGVHIADATFFCRPGTAIDDEATHRGTSVYLVDATIPMLPHQLSSNICSLKADEDRLAFSAVFRINKQAQVLERRFEKSIIRSQKRFTYEEAQKILDGGNGGPEQNPVARPQAVSEGFVRPLRTLWSLAQILRKNREEQGAIDFGDNEVRFTLDEKGKPISVVRKERINTNLLIEEFMLLANKEVATYISNLAAKVPEKNYVFLYRIHDEPKPDRIEELATFVRAVGYDFASYSAKASKDKHRKPSAKDIRNLLKQIEGKPEEHLIRTATLRSMAKALYSTKNIGHFGLSFEYYTHFTSPIRRYPDMLVHRILASHLDGHPIDRREYTNLESLCLSASAREAEATDAERESIRYKQVEFMSGKVGQTFDGVISGVTDWGLYVEEKMSAAEGLVRVATIGNDFYNYSQKEYALIGERTKKKFALGDRVRITLVAADLASRQLDFELAQAR